MRRVLTLGEVTLAAAVSAAAYWALYRAQRDLFLNGVPPHNPYAFPRLDSDFLTALEALDRYWLATTAVLVVFGYVVVRSRSSAWRLVAWFPLSLGAMGLLVALPARPGLSIDALSYLSHGWIADAPGGNPYLTASAEVGSSSYGQLLFAEGWLPVHGVSPYGPLWTHVERLAFAISGGDIGRGLLALKVVVVLAVGVSTLLIWLIARQIRPGWELTAALAFAWSPLVIVEFAIEGHNDAVAIAFTLLGLWAAVTNRAIWAVLGLGLGALTKITPAVFAVPVLVLLVRCRTGWSSLVRRLAAGVLVTAGLAWLLYRRFWAGPATFDGLRAGSVPYPSWSPAGWLGAWFGAQAGDAPDYRPGLVLAALLIMVVAVVSWQRTACGLMVACGSIAVAAMALTPAYWPWYAALPVAVLAARGTWVAMAQVFVLTVGSRIAAPYGDLFVIGVVPFERAMQLSTLWGVDVPVALCLLLAVGSVVVRRLRAGPTGAQGDETGHP